MSFLRKIVVGGAIASPIVYVTFNQHKSRPSDLEMRNAKIHEMALHKIKDKHTAKTHEKTLSALPIWDASLDAQQKEKYKDRSSCSVRYLQGKLQQRQGHSASLAVFEIAQKQTLNASYEGFSYIDSLFTLQLLEMRKSIQEGNYLRCKEVLPIMDSGMPLKEDVLILGTTDIRKCHRLEKDILIDAAQLAAGMSSISLDPEHPIVDTPVFSAKEMGFQSEGDLGALSKSAKEAIRHNQFVPCTFYSIFRTRLSKSNFKQVGAIVTETQDPDNTNRRK
jgi:hypothetical protein